MQRIAVIGCCGAGKSWLSLELARRTGLPVVHLDRLHWQPGWVERTKAEFVAAQEAALPLDGAWIADGNYRGSMALRLARADTVLFLDYSTPLCLKRAVQRRLTYLNRSRPDVTEGCHETLDLEFLRFLQYVALFRRRDRPKIVEKLKTLGPTQRLVTMRRPRDATRFLGQLA
jgi:adenylate kinase family enzyme